MRVKKIMSSGRWNDEMDKARRLKIGEVFAKVLESQCGIESTKRIFGTIFKQNLQKEKIDPPLKFHFSVQKFCIITK